MRYEERRGEWGELPHMAVSADGAEFFPRAESWRFRSGVREIFIDFSALEGCSPLLVSEFRRLMLWYVENRSASHAQGVYQRFLHFARFHKEYSGIEEITSDHIIRYRAALGPDHKWYLTTLSGSLMRWVDLGYLGVHDEAYKLLKRLRLSGNRKGEAVRTACPISGPLTDIEFTGLLTALKNALRHGVITDEQYLMAWLCIGFAIRPSQVAALKICDLVKSELFEGSDALRIPRAKQRHQSIRGEFKERPLLSELALQLERQRDDVTARMKQEFCPEGMPLFPAPKSASSWAPGFEWHSTSREISERIIGCLEGLDVHSERTGLPMRLNATRLRRTLGTRAAAEGRGEMVIAELLDHSDLQNVRVYVEARPDIIDRLNEAIASALAPLAQAFAGEIIDEGAEHAFPGGRIADPRFGARTTLGKCASGSACSLVAPTGCYTCPSFRAWRDGPHRELLQFLLAERDRIKDISGERIAAVNDRTILAVAEVISLCAGIGDE